MQKSSKTGKRRVGGKFIQVIKIAVLCILGLGGMTTDRVIAAETNGLPEYSRTYDPDRDPFSDLVSASNRAHESDKLVLLIVGGYWCSWCHTLDRYLEKNAEFSSLFFKTFEVVKVYYGEKNTNEFFLSKFPEIKGYPHLFILDSNFELLGSQNTGTLEKRKRNLLSSEQYQEEPMQEFLDNWAIQLQLLIKKTRQPPVESDG